MIIHMRERGRQRRGYDRGEEEGGTREEEGGTREESTHIKVSIFSVTNNRFSGGET